MIYRRIIVLLIICAIYFQHTIVLSSSTPRTRDESLILQEKLRLHSELKAEYRELFKRVLAIKWEKFLAYLQYPAKDSMHVYYAQPRTFSSKTTNALFGVDAATNTVQTSRDSLFTIFRHIPHQLYYILTHGRNYLCANAKFQSLTTRGKNSAIYDRRAKENVWCDWMTVLNTNYFASNQKYLVPIEGYVLYFTNSTASTFGPPVLSEKIVLRNSIYSPVDMLTDTLFGQTNVLYINDKVSTLEGMPAWNVIHKSTEMLERVTSFHKALERTRFTPQIYVPAAASDEYTGSTKDIYVFRNTFEIKKIFGSNAREGSLCLCWKELHQLLVFPCKENLPMCQWTMEDSIEGSNEIVFKSMLQK